MLQYLGIEYIFYAGIKFENDMGWGGVGCFMILPFNFLPCPVIILC